MKIVAENSESDIKRRQARDEVVWPLTELTANLLRVTRGAGKPYEIGRQAVALINAMQNHWDVVGQYPSSDELTVALDIDPSREFLEGGGEEFYEEVHAQQQVIRGALQIAASRLLSQRTQESAGERELREGTRGLARVAEARRKKWAEETRKSKVRRK